MPERGPSFADIKGELLRRLDSLVREIAPRGKKNGAYWMASDPTGSRPDKTPSFWILLHGQAAGCFRDEVTQQKGDVLDAIQHCCRLQDRRAVRAWAMSWLGWDQGIDRKQLEQRRVETAAQQAKDDEAAKAALAKKRTSAKGWWLSGAPQIEGTLAETYLASRGVRLADLAAPPRALRFLASAEHHDPDGVVTDWPCMIAAMCDVTGAIVAVHRTFLAADGSGKAPVKPAKMIWPHGYQGSVIRLARGTGNLTPEQAARRGHAAPVLLAEGIENALSVAVALPELRVWAAGTLGNLSHVPVQHPCISKVIVFADNDAGPQAQASLDKAVAALRRQRPVTVARSFAGKDANDLLRGKND